MSLENLNKITINKSLEKKYILTLQFDIIQTISACFSLFSNDTLGGVK